MKESTVEEVLKRFDEHFETKTKERLKNKFIIMNVFNQFVNEIYEPNETYNIVIKTKEEIEKQLKLNDEQKELFKKWEVCKNTIVNNFIETSFIYGFIVEDELKEQCKK